MFSVYGTEGRMFKGTLEELSKVGPTSAIARSRRVQAIGRDTQDMLPSAWIAAPHKSPSDMAHRAALAAYADTVRADVPRHPLSLVQDIMSHSVVSVASDATVAQAWAQLVQHQIGQAPVLGGDSVLVGLLTRAELMRSDRLPGPDSHALVWRALLSQSVLDVMWTPVPGVAADTDIRRVARVLLDTGLPGLPVVDDDGHVVGFVSRTDILHAVVADPPLDLWT